jgi:predicted RNA-binding Zn-ribbon protein involved in translation (DUF1610 family)
MNCPNCGGDNFTEFFTEDIVCAHCGENNKVYCYMCEDCAAMFKVSDGKLIEESVVTEDYPGQIQLVSELVTTEFPVSSAPSAMEDVIHKCLRCNTISYEVSEGSFHCPECGFEWEVIKFE